MQFLDLHAARVFVEKLNLFFAAAVQDDFLQSSRQFIERCFDIKFVMRRQALDHLVVVGGLAVPATNRAARQRQAGVHNDPRRVEELLDAKTIAARAGAGRVIE